MKLRTVIFIIFAVLLFSGITKAQVSGYMGKRLMAKFDTYTNIYIPESFEISAHPFSIRKSAGIEYVAFRNVSVGASYYFCKSSFNSMDGVGTMNNKGISLGASVFSDDGLTPIGRFLRYEMIYYKSAYTIAIDDYNDMTAWAQNVKSIKTGDIGNVVFSLTFGQSAVLFDRVNLSYGFQLGYRLGYVIDNLSKPDGLSTPDQIKYDIHLRNMNHTLWGFHIGIGYLLF